MRKFVLGAMLLCLAFVVSYANAQEVSFRNATIVEISEIEVPASSARGSSEGNSATKRAGMRSIKRALNRGIARAAYRIGGGEYAADVYDVGSSVAEDVVDGVANSGGSARGATAKAHLVVVRFEGGGETGIQVESVRGLRVGQRVRVMGSGSSARISPR